MDVHFVVLGFGLNAILLISAATAIVLELAFLRATHHPVDVADAGRSVATGLLWAVVRVFGGKALLFGTWLWVWRDVTAWHWSMSNPLTWLAYVLIGDLLYYWTHRAEHRVRVLWSSHLVHHSSEQFNLATAVRQPWTEVFYKPLVALWAPLLGFHPLMYVIVGVISLMAGQWQHLERFPKVRWLDALVMTPSNHRVHHGRNPSYIDRNFGGSLVLWDRLFGTYVRETEPPQYGIIHAPPPTTVRATALGGLPELIVDMRATRGARARAALALGRP